MDTIQTSIQSLIKSSASEPWKMTFVYPENGRTGTVVLNRNNGVEVGPRLREVLSSIDRQQTYPRTITGEELEILGMATSNSFTIKILANVPVYVEIGLQAFRRFTHPSFPKIKGIHGEVAKEATSTSQPMFNIQALDEPVGDGGSGITFTTKVSSADYLLIGAVKQIKDGDTISFLIEHSGSKTNQNSLLKPGKTIDVRFAGVNTPETREHGIEKGKQGNIEFCQAYGVSEEQAFDIADEALAATQVFLGGSGYVAIELDSNVDGTPKVDKYGRWVGAIYKTSYLTPAHLLDAIPFTAKVATKMLLGTKSHTKATAPLAIPFYYFIDNEYSRLPVEQWLYDLGIRIKDGDKIGDKIKEDESKKTTASNPIQDGSVVEFKYTGSASNQIDFFEPYDDRIDKFYPGNVSNHRVRIGDVILTIPPLAIDSNRVSSINKVKTLRSKSSLMVKGGSSVSTLTLQLYFHDLESVNGRKELMHKDKDRYYYMDGLRPLIAQFKKAPFLPIDNKYINEVLGIDSVALVNLSVQTVPGFPHSLAATLTLVKFEHEAYMVQAERLGTAINYPMLRWYYQEALRDIPKESRSPYRTYLDPIPDTGLTNEWTFQSVSEEELIRRKQAIQGIRQMDAPLLAEEKFESHQTETGKQYKDGVMAQKVLDQYNRYMALKKSGKITKKRNSKGEMEENNLITVDETFWPQKKVFADIYGEGKKDRDVLKVSHYAPFESWMHFYETRSGMGMQDGQEASSWPEENNGVMKLRLFSTKNIALFSKKWQETAEKDGELTSIWAPGTEISILNKIIARGKEAENNYRSEIAKWQELNSIIQETEGNLTLQDEPIDGLLVTSMNVMYENQFSNIQLQALDGPSFQFLGGQDPYVQVTFEANDNGVAQLRELLVQTEKYSREYRTGITSGFLGVRNHLIQLFGIETVMPEGMQVRTVPGFPGRYQIEMTLCGFNKTQKRTEALEGISPIYGDKISLESRKSSEYVAGADEAIIELKMRKMEVYPDLELPTYEELKAALPYIGANCSVYDNRTHGIYVDPDFYVSTPITAREIIREKIKDGTTLTMNDMMGVEMTTSSKSPNPLDGEASMWDILNAVDASTTQINSSFSWSGLVSDADGGDSNKDGVVFVSAEVQNLLKDRKKLNEPPTEDEFKKWGLGDIKTYDYWLEKKANPTEADVYSFIAKQVDNLWVSKKFVYNDKKVDPKNAAWRKITYSLASDMYAVNYNYLASISPELIKKGGKKTKKTKLSLKDYKATKNMITRERMINLIKSVIHVTSKWQQITSARTPLLVGGNAAGIGGVPLTSEGTSTEIARRLLWDWKYNLGVAIKQLYEAYIFAVTKEDIKWKSRPWDWMIAAYATGTIETELESPFWQQVNDIHTRYYCDPSKIYGTPTTSTNIKVMQAREGLSSHQLGLITGDKDAYIKELLATGYRKDKKNKADTEKWLKEQSSSKLREVYEKWQKDLFDTGKPVEEMSWTEMNSGASMTNDMKDKENKAKYTESAEIYETYEESMDYIENEATNRLVNKTDPQDIFPEMFVDMIEYDQRFRLLRAFPTFQMFIIDEGKWITNYRLWDNLYGFNAIQSIDVHKSRKIAADTAIIKMTNIYSNLTSRAMDSSYGEWGYDFIDNLVFGNPNEKLLESRNELLNSMMLQTGARIHLRMGYGSSAVDLPVVFNGTITELNAEETVDIVAQGDGVELGNVISGDPGDDNKGFFKITEPRDLICELLTSKGNWFKDVVNYNTGNKLFRDNPLGIMHFGVPGEKTPEGNIKWFNENYGEATQNIYSSNGAATFSQWSMPDGTDIPFSWTTPVLKWLQPGDEQNIAIAFYNNTVWDIAQTIAYCSPDYITAVHPFELRSTLFFGKPYWKMAYKYDSRYEYDTERKSWTRYVDMEHRKPYAQVHMFDSYMDIVSNKVKASEEGVYTNVIVNYDGKQTPVIYADFDIRFDKQKTTIIDAQIISRMAALDFWTSEKQAMYYGMSAVRDYMKDMYKGELVVLGDPTIKPHDICFMNDVMSDMQGNFQVKAVTHHFSHETGFITSVQPDAMVVNDDMAMMNLNNWIWSTGISMAAGFLAYRYAAKTLREVIPSAVSSAMMKAGKKGAASATEMALSQLAKWLPEDDPDVKSYKYKLSRLKDMPMDDVRRKFQIDELIESATKIEGKLAMWDKDLMFTNEAGQKIKGAGSYVRMKRTVSAIKQTSGALRDGAKAFKLVKAAGFALAGFNPLSLLAAAVTTWVVESIAEKYRRKKSTMQAVVMMPLMYQGRQYTAGINGHAGMVVGDNKPGKIDGFLQGFGLDGKDGEGGFTDLEWAVDAWNWLTEAEGKDYNITQEDIKNGNWKNK